MTGVLWLAPESLAELLTAFPRWAADAERDSWARMLAAVDDGEIKCTVIDTVYVRDLNRRRRDSARARGDERIAAALDAVLDQVDSIDEPTLAMLVKAWNGYVYLAWLDRDLTRVVAYLRLPDQDHR